MVTPIAPLSHQQNGHSMVTRSKSGIFKKKVYLSTKHQVNIPSTDCLDSIEPATFTEPSMYPAWRQAMSEEFYALQRQGTWTLVPCSSKKHVVGCRWVYKIKHHPDGSVAKFKARLVAKGFHQEHGIDYTETFSPVVKHSTIRIALSLAVYYNWTIQQLEVTNAFLHGILHEDIYMSQPQGFVDSNFPDHLCKLHKSSYGLKQAPRAWFERFSNFLLSLGFHNTYADSRLFFKHYQSSITVILIYVDGIVITGNDTGYISSLISQLSLIFEMKHLGDLHHFLGVEVHTSPNGLYLSQTKYAYDLLVKTSMLGCKPCCSPCNYKSLAQPTVSNELPNPTTYCSITGALQYLTLTRPDLSFVVNQACQHMHHPIDADFAALKRILRDIKGTISYGICFNKGPLQLVAFSEADWAVDPID